MNYDQVDGGYIFLLVLGLVNFISMLTQYYIYGYFKKSIWSISRFVGTNFDGTPYRKRLRSQQPQL